MLIFIHVLERSTVRHIILRIGNKLGSGTMILFDTCVIVLKQKKSKIRICLLDQTSWKK